LNLFLLKIFIDNLICIFKYTLLILDLDSNNEDEGENNNDNDDDDDDSTPIPPISNNSQFSEDSFENLRLQKAG
jgi:hypothetical protein